MPKRNVMVVKNDFAKVTAEVRGAVSEEVRSITLDLLALSMPLVPLEDGELIGSGSAHFGGERIATGADYSTFATGGKAATGPQGSDELTGVVMYSTVYAAMQHERTDLAHPQGGQAKYLETPLEQNRGQYLKRIADAIAEKL